MPSNRKNIMYRIGDRISFKTWEIVPKLLPSGHTEERVDLHGEGVITQIGTSNNLAWYVVVSDHDSEEYDIFETEITNINLTEEVDQLLNT